MRFVDMCALSIVRSGDLLLKAAIVSSQDGFNFMALETISWRLGMDSSN